MPQEVRMPSLGQTSDELRIVKWFRAEGDTVQMGERLFEVETDKATLEVEAVAAGTVLQIVAQAGEIVQAGSLVAYIGNPGELLPAPPVSGFKESSAISYQLSVGSTENRQPKTENHLRSKVLASPAVRQLARTHGIDLDGLRGSGPDGRIEKEDVLRLVEDQDKKT